jgi:hypothetical protein
LALLAVSCGSSDSEAAAPAAAQDGVLLTISDRNEPGRFVPFITDLSNSEVQFLDAHVPAGQSVVADSARLSPDGGHLAFVSAHPVSDARTAVVVDLGDDTSSVVFQDAGFVMDSPVGGIDPSVNFWFSPDSARLVMEVASNDDTTLMDADGRNPRTLNLGGAYLEPVGWLPDSTAFVTIADEITSNGRVIFNAGVGATADQVIDPLPEDLSRVRRLHIGPGGRTLAGSVQGDATINEPMIFGVDLETAGVSIFDVDDIDEGAMRISDSGRFIASTASANEDLWVCDMDTLSCERAAPFPLQGATTVKWFEWEPGGARLAFLGNFQNSAAEDVFLFEPGGGAQVISTDQVGDASHPVWSPAGGGITFMHDGGTVRGLYLHDASLSVPLRLVDADVTIDGVAPTAWSPNGAWIYANRELSGGDTALSALPVDPQAEAINLGPAAMGLAQPGSLDDSGFAFGANSGVVAWRAIFEAPSGASAISIFTAAQSGAGHDLGAVEFPGGGESISAFLVQD